MDKFISAYLLIGYIVTFAAFMAYRPRRKRTLEQNLKVFSLISLAWPLYFLVWVLDLIIKE